MDIVPTVLRDLDTYLRKYLPVDKRLVSALYGWKPALIDTQAHKYIYAQDDRGENDLCFQKWLAYAVDHYKVQTLEEWCKCLKDVATDSKPKLKVVAVAVEKKLREVQKQHEKVEPSRESGKRVPEEHTEGNDSMVTPSESLLDERTDADEIDSDQPSNQKAEKFLQRSNGGKLVEETCWDDLKTAICCIKCGDDVTTGFVVEDKTSSACYLMTTLHSFLDDKELYGNVGQTVMGKARGSTYCFFYTKEEKGMIIKGQDILLSAESPHAVAKVDKVMDMVAVPVSGDDFKKALPEVKPIELPKFPAHKKKKNWLKCCITLIGHPLGLPLSRSNAFIMKSVGDTISYECDTLKGSSGSPIVIATDSDKLTVVGMHRSSALKSKDSFNFGSLLEYFKFD